MTRSLVTLGLGILGALALVVIIAPFGPLVAAAEWLLVLATIAVGLAVMAVVARRVALRNRAEQLSRDLDGEPAEPDRWTSSQRDEAPTYDRRRPEEPDRG